MSGVKTVICTHGFWSHGAGMFLVKRRLEREYGWRVLLFSYPSVRGTLDENAESLYQFVQAEAPDGAHIVGHSLGGVVALRMYANTHDAPDGRLVCLGSPLTGSRAAEFLLHQDWGAQILGHSMPDGVIRGSANEWAGEVCAQRDIGIIAGDVPIGFGQYVADFGEDNDGTVAVSETRLDGARDHILLPVSHKGMLVSPIVADQAAAFLKRGEFLRDD